MTTVGKTREANVVRQTHFVVVPVTRCSNSIGEDVTKAKVPIPYRFLDFSDWGGVNLSLAWRRRFSCCWGCACASGVTWVRNGLDR